MTAYRSADGRFVSRFCPDPNCGGELVQDAREAWIGGPPRPTLRCDGLTHRDDHSPLEACAFEIDTALFEVKP